MYRVSFMFTMCLLLVGCLASLRPDPLIGRWERADGLHQEFRQDGTFSNVNCTGKWQRLDRSHCRLTLANDLSVEGEYVVCNDELRVDGGQAYRRRR